LEHPAGEANNTGLLIRLNRGIYSIQLYRCALDVVNFCISPQTTIPLRKNQIHMLKYEVLGNLHYPCKNCFRTHKQNLQMGANSSTTYFTKWIYLVSVGQFNSSTHRFALMRCLLYSQLPHYWSNNFLFKH